MLILVRCEICKSEMSNWRHLRCGNSNRLLIWFDWPESKARFICVLSIEFPCKFKHPNKCLTLPNNDMVIYIQKLNYRDPKCILKNTFCKTPRCTIWLMHGTIYKSAIKCWRGYRSEGMTHCCRFTVKVLRCNETGYSEAKLLRSQMHT